MKTATKSAPTKSTTKNSIKTNGRQTSPGAENGLRKLLEEGLKDIYWAEKALTKAIPKMIKKATSAELVEALNEHLSVTTEQVARLEEVFETMGKKSQAKKCEAMEGLIKEATQIMEESEEGVLRDAGIIAAAQKVEHYEIATYGTLKAWAKTLGEEDIATLLEETLNEEKEADEKLTQVAESSINIAASEGGDDDMEMEDDEEEVDVDEVEEVDEMEEVGKSKASTKSKRK